MSADGLRRATEAEKKFDDLRYLAERWATAGSRAMIHCGKEVLRILNDGGVG